MSRGRSWSPPVHDRCPDPHRDRRAVPTCHGRVVAMIQSSANGTTCQRYDDHGQTMGTATRPQAAEQPSNEPLTRTNSPSGRRDSNPRPSPWQREENPPPGPPSPLTWSPVRPFVRLVRPVRPFRIPVYHRPRKRTRLLVQWVHGYNGVMDRITVNPRQMGGVPCIRGLRIPVATVVGMIADGMTPDEIVAELPPLELDDVSAALRFAADAVADREIPLQPTA